MEIPICRECKFLSAYQTCGAVGVVYLNPVTGVKTYPRDAGEEREEGGSCGPTGVNFVQRVIWFGSWRVGAGE